MRPKPLPLKLGQESVWDYPRPPRLEATTKRIRIVFNGELIADTIRAKRVLETSHPPTYYIPPDDIRQEFVQPGNGRSFCEWKGAASYVTLEVHGKRLKNVGWYYADLSPGFATIKDHIAFYAAPMDECTVDGERVTPQPGNFYGGWVTNDVVGPFKGETGTTGW